MTRGATMTGAGVLERDHELSVLTGVLDAAAAGRGTLVWVEGPSGIGKTRLLETVRERAGARGMTVLAARAARLERDFSFGVVRGLFEPLVAAASEVRRAELLAGAARFAAPVVSPDVPPDPAETGDTDAGSTLHGVYWLTANLAEAGPVLLVVDDAHVADPASLRAVAYLARRLAELPVAIVLGAQPPTVDTASPVVDALREAEATTVLRPAPLSRDGVSALVGARFPVAPDPAFSAACHEATGGNPLLVHALLTAVLEAGGDADAAGVAAVAELAPAVVATFVARRLREAGEEAAAVAGAVALLEGRAELRHVVAVTGLDPAAVARGAETLVGVRLLRPGRPLTFAHPLFGQAVAERADPAARHRGHRRAADALAADGAGAELVAAHLLHTEALGDPVVVARLRAAGRAALAKGVPETAMTYLRRAVAEPPPPEERPTVLHELGAATARVSHREGVALLEDAFAAAVHPHRRGLIALELARALSVTLAFDRALQVLDEAAAGLDDGSELATELAAATVGLARRDPARRAASAELTRTLRRDGRLPRHGGAALLATTALDALQTEADTTAVDLAHEALATTLRESAPDPGVILPATMVLVAIDHLEPVRAAAEGILASARRRGSTYDFISACVLRTQTRYLQGELAEAEADARLADGLAVEHAVHAARRYTLAWLVIVLVERGLATEADETLARSGVRGDLAYLMAARGLLHLALGRPTEAVDAFVACGDRLAHRGIHHPGVLPWQSGVAVALHRLGRDTEAVTVADEAVRTARRFAASRALAVALRTRGLVGGTIEPLREAVTLLEPTPARLELARTRIELGGAMRRAGQRVAARTELAAGQDLARRCGADPLVARAGDELRASGARPRRLAMTGADALTASERRVAELAADGLSNRDVAQALFVTTKTVETHLGHAYRKLGVTGRDELAARLP
ncbi:ATP-binding protein [Actinomycetospora chibensis]|uniref:ATP-binding protein n=1 Tax=Actinomycetospora chibensis TaxID=663606 RepID=A0ABV9RKL7_9PSEU|nr:LuxR family transcriptional regulator [Actinomycetospora chibensis]MDD7927007.1 AAA family ATPase [Actinomycetospora chibensis]